MKKDQFILFSLFLYNILKRRKQIDKIRMSTSKKHINFSLIEDTFEETSNPIDTIVKNIKAYSQQNGNLLQKFNQQFFLTYFDRNTIQQALTKLGNEQNQKKELKLSQFIRTFLSIIQHKEQETLFLAMSLRILFLKIKEQTNNQNGVKFSDFTNYLCQRIAKQNPDLIVPLKQVPQQKNTPDVNRIRQIDINCPIVLKEAENDLPKIAKQKKKKDKKLSQRKPVSKIIFNEQTKQIIALGRLSSCIYFYDLELKKLPTQIVPKTYRDMSREIAILSMAFNQSNERIGAIINGIGIAFWQASDNYQTQKTISKYYGEKIYYLKLFKQWITSDKNTIYFWDVKQQAISKRIYYPDSAIINDVCEINHLRCICVSYTTKDDRKLFVVYKDTKPIVTYDMGTSGCHTLHYNLSTQMIVTAGYHNQLEVFEIQNKTYSVNLKKQLKGHTSIVTCVSDIKNTNFILSGDDSGQVRIWQLNFMKCIQVVKISKYINQLYCTDNKLIFSDTRLNTMQMDKFGFNNAVEDQQIFYHFFQEDIEAQFIVTRKSIRKLNFNTGRIQLIFVVCGEEQEISSALRISSGILIGTSKGILKLYTTEGKIKWQIQAHQEEICQLKYDRKTRFIFSLGTDNKLMIWPQKSILTDGVKKIITFKNKNFNILTIFNEVRLLFLGSSQQNEICVWDYQNLKLLTIIKLNSPIFFMQINHLYRILMISTIFDEFYFLKLIWKNGYLHYQMIYNGDSSFSGVKKSKKANNLSVEDDSKIQIANLLGNERKSKKQNSKQSFSKNVINKDNKCDIFLTSTKLDDQNIRQSLNKKYNMKVSVKNLQFQNQISKQEDSSNLPSIKVIKQQSSQKHCEQIEQTIGTLKTLKKIDNQITTKIQIKQSQEGGILVVGNSKGQICCYNIDQLIKEHFLEHQVPLKKNESPHIYRPIKEDYQFEILKQKHCAFHIQTIDQISKVKKSYFKLLWKQSMNTKEPITWLNFIQMKKIYLSITMTDGYCKYFDLLNGQIKGNVKITLPLPILWDIKVEKDSFIKKNIYQTLLVLDDILTNYGFQMLSKQYKAINITKFLQLLKKQKVIKNQSLSKKKIQISKSTTKQKDKITLLHEQYSMQDLKNVNKNQNTLKSLQAYKRVKQIKDQMVIQVKQKNSKEQANQEGIKKVSVQTLRQKQEIQRLFAPNYFPVLAQFGSSSKLNKSIELGSLEQRSIILLEKISNKKKLRSQYTIEKERQTKSRRQKSQFPILPTLRSQYSQSKAIEEGNKQNQLLKKLNTVTTSNSTLSRANGLQFVSIYSDSCAASSLLKSSSNGKPLNFLNSDKSRQFLTKRAGLQDKPMKQILNDINEKLSKYKKASYGKRNIL